ncbi:MAG: type II secretion system F family protein [Armatimonadetes bacterium]|nr:type II secretion system F family protein [Armatimonadota bacterium]
MPSYSYHCLQPDGSPTDGVILAVDQQEARQKLQERGFRILSVRAATSLSAPRAYGYRCLEMDGTTISGTLTASSEEEARQQLIERGLRILELERPGRKARPAPPERIPAEAVRAPEAPPTQRPPPVVLPKAAGVRLPLRALNLFTLQFEVMISAGITYLRALEALANTPDLQVAQVAHQLLDKVSAGTALSKGMASMPRTFDAFYVRMVRVGETTGSMHRVLRQIGQALSRDQEKRSRLISALTYPAMVLTASLLMITFLVYFMLPGYLVLFTETGAELPLPTRALVWISSSSFPLLLVSGLVAALLALVVSARYHPRSRRTLERLVHRIPRIGSLLRQYLVIRVVRNIALMLHTGVPLMEALDLLSRPTTGDAEMDLALQEVRSELASGAGIAQAFRVSPRFPRFLVDAIAAGEEVGKVPEFLERWAGMLEEDLEYSLDALIQLLEPAMLMVMGLVVGFIVLAAFLPVFALLKTL